MLYVESDGVVYVVPATGEAEWFRSAERRGEARLRWEDGREATSAVRVVHEAEEMERVRSLLRSKYGERTFRRYFAGATKGLRLDPRAPASAIPPDEALRAEFDSVAPGYDASVASKPVERYLKERAAAHFATALADRDPLLEIGPGTGFHTLRLLDQGHRIVAVDVSERMLQRLRDRAAAAGRSDQLEMRPGRFRDLAGICRDIPDGTFQGVFSAFGAFNLEPELRTAVPTLARLTASGARVVFTSLNRPGLSPMLWETLAGRPGHAMRHVRDVLPVGGSRYPLELYVPSLAGWDRLMRPSFRRRGVAPVSVAAPPFDSDRLTEFSGRQGSSRARALDTHLARWPLAWVAAEWVLLTYERAPEPITGPRAPKRSGPSPR